MNLKLNGIALPSFVLGYHGCSRRIAEDVLSGKTKLRASTNDYDWLGHGVYFWEHNPKRALDWAAQNRKRKGWKSIAILGAIIDLKQCLNLLDSSNLEIVQSAYGNLASMLDKAGHCLPENSDESPDRIMRNLDCAVINHAANLATKAGNKIDTVRGVFVEGGELYPGAGFRQKNHIQICVMNLDSIVGYFRVKV